MNIIYVGSQLNSPKLDTDKFRIKTIPINEQYLCQDNQVLDIDISKRLRDLVTTINGPTHIIQEACTHLILPSSICNKYKNKSLIRLQAVQNLTNEIIKQVNDNKYINGLTILPNITIRSHKICNREDCQHDNLEHNVNNKWERINKLESFFYKKAEENPQRVKFASSNTLAQKYGDKKTKELYNHYIQHTRKKLEAKHKLPLPTIEVNKNRNAYEKTLFEYDQDCISRKIILDLILDTQEKEEYKHQNKDHNAQRQYTRNANYNSSYGSNSSAAYGQSSSKNYGYNDKAYYRQETSNSHGESYKNSSQSSGARSNSSRNSNMYSPKHTSQETENQIQMIPENKIKKEKKEPEIITLEDEKLPNMQNRLSRQNRSLSPCLSYASSRGCSSPPRKVREISPPSTPRESIKSPSPQRSRGKRSISREFILETENDISFDKTMKDSEKEKHPSPSNTESSKKIKISIENYIQQRTTEIKADMDIEHNTRVTAFQNQIEIHHDTRYAHFEKNINDIQTKTRVGIIEQVHSETRETREKAITEMQEEITTFKNKTIDSVKENFNTLQEEYKKALQEIKDTYQLDTYKLKIPQYNSFQLYSSLPPENGNENNSSSHTNGFADYLNDSQSTNPMEQSTSSQNNGLNSAEGKAEQHTSEKEQDEYLSDDYLKDAEKDINAWKK